MSLVITMSLENEVEREATIDFPKPLDLREARRFLNYLARGLHADFRCTYLHDVYLIHYDGILGTERLKESSGSTEVKVSVISKEARIANGTFALKPDLEDSLKLGKIKFETKNDKILDYSSEVIKLWRETRILTNQYFGLSSDSFFYKNVR